ncbi:MAG TPA: hypothetical protein PLI27_09365 [Ignavibacteriales bacterium]|nr:hypothetical protein [Ignavibacteriales bacterium]HOL80186.1 hypothetical protein [Ignavibacteriales bacterium]HOM64468.1 hypothetical protein [Ignavibacteriales bacterium]HPD68267.1 hypothetical protein [Ignavibacteriales bacterium]HPP32375.1 hypothetical protein [Ignavibacteriales bacterium]
MEELKKIFEEIEQLLIKVNIDELDFNDELIIEINNKIEVLNIVFKKLHDSIKEEEFEKVKKYFENNIKKINELFDNIIRNYKIEIDKENKKLISVVNNKKLSNYLK